jgi:hypothetical protein
MTRRQSKHGLERVWPAVVMMVAWLAGSAAVWAAEPATTPGTNVDASVVLDDNSVWRHFVVSRCAFARTPDGKLEPWDLTPLGIPAGQAGIWPGIAPKPATSTASSPLPPTNWAGVNMDDGTWPRVRLPLPTPAGEGNRPQTRYGATAALLVRGKFEVKDPAQVKSCRLSLEYLGGVVIYVNGVEAIRRDMSGDKPDLLALAADYPAEAFTNPKGDYANKPPKRERSLQDFEIPAKLLRPGVNVLAIETHTAPVTVAYVKRASQEAHSMLPWAPIGLLHARLSVTPVGAVPTLRPDSREVGVGTNLARPRGIRVWNCAAYDTLSVFDFGDPCESLRPVAIQAARNSVFSGRLMVSSGQAIKGLKVKVSDLKTTAGGATLPASAVQVRYAVAVVPGELPSLDERGDDPSGGQSHLPPHRFDGLLELLPVEIPVSQAPAPADRKSLVAGAVAPLWFTVRVPREAKAGVYQGQIAIEAEGLPLTNVPLRVSICDWAMMDAKDFRMRNMAFHNDGAVAAHYKVPLWSDKHLEMVGQSHALMGEAGSRHFYVNLENFVRWIKQPDGSFKHDFTLFDKYLEMIAKSVGKPQPLRLQAWGDRQCQKSGPFKSPMALVSVLDPATGKTEPFKSPITDEAAALAFWKPVFDGAFQRIKARGWLDATVFGFTSDQGGPDDFIANLTKQLWPEGAWVLVSHEVTADWKDNSNPWVKLRYACGVYRFGYPSVRGYSALLRDRPVFFCNEYRGNWRNFSPLTLQRRVGEDIIMSGRDGVSDFGADLFMYRDAKGNLQVPGGPEWPSGPGRTQHAMLYPGPDGPVASERYEMFREGVEIAETLFFIEQAIQEKKLSPELQKKAEQALEARSNAFIMDWFTIRDMPGAEEDAKLLSLAGEVARGMGKK